jgi:prephenate dehydrogenase
MKIAIIGGSGQMGEWFSRFFTANGHTVIISGRNRKKCVALSKRVKVLVAKNNAEAVNGADLVISSVLVGNMPTVLQEIAPYLRNDQIIIDITSVKTLPVKMMHRYLKKGKILGTHPMFGPSAPSKGQNFILTPTNKEERKTAKLIKRLLKPGGFNIIIMSPHKHDEMIGVIMSLTHFVGLVTAASWKKLKIERYMKKGSTSFNFLFRFAKSVVDSNPELYSYLQMSVPSVNYAEDVFLENAKKWSDMVKKKKSAEFVASMKELSNYLNSLEL